MVKKLQNFINGEWVDSCTGKFTDVVNPATQEVIATCPDSSKEDMDKAVRSAKEAFKEWRQTPVLSRARYFYEYKEKLEDNFEEIAKLMVMDCGKTLDEARGEIRRGIESIEFAISVPSLMTGFKVEDISSQIDETAERQPLGVMGAITPFNFPFMVPLWFWPTAVACGNTYIVKPSPQDPLSLDLQFKLLEDIDFPEGVISLVHGGIETSNALMEHPDVKGISFVGSSTVGKLIYEKSAKFGKRVQVQGGAKNFIAVMPDADVSASVSNILGAAYGCAGQRCLAASVMIAVGDIYEPLMKELTNKASNMKVGSGLDESNHVGAIISKSSTERIKSMIDAGVKEGARLVLDGRKVIVDGFEKGNFIGPTIFDGVTKDMSLAKDEIFGPVLSVMHVPDFEAAVQTINMSKYGNAASLFTSSGKYAREFKYQVNAGNIGINIGVAAPTASFPFGGQGESFFGDTHGQGPDAINFFTDHKVVIERWL